MQQARASEEKKTHPRTVAKTTMIFLELILIVDLRTKVRKRLPNREFTVENALLAATGFLVCEPTVPEEPEREQAERDEGTR